MKIAYLGSGAWGFCLASLLAGKGYQVAIWSAEEGQVKWLSEKNEHKMLPGYRAKDNMSFTTDMEKALQDADVVVESVTSKGIRPVFQKLKELGGLKVPAIITSKGIEQGSGLTLPEVVLEVLGKEASASIGVLSGPSFAQDVIQGLPTSVVGSGNSDEVLRLVCDLFTTSTFRVYPNSDLLGVCYGGSLKNIIAIACGISGGLCLGASCSAALMTRGLHEIRKLAVAKGGKPETLYGLSGMGDLCLTCGSTMSRNYRFGELLAKGNSPDLAREKISMVVEGAYTCVSALELSQELHVKMPITEMVYKIIYEGFAPSEAVDFLMQRTIKEEHL